MFYLDVILIVWFDASCTRIKYAQGEGGVGFEAFNHQYKEHARGRKL